MYSPRLNVSKRQIQSMFLRLVLSNEWKDHFTHNVRHLNARNIQSGWCLFHQICCDTYGNGLHFVFIQGLTRVTINDISQSDSVHLNVNEFTTNWHTNFKLTFGKAPFVREWAFLGDCSEIVIMSSCSTNRMKVASSRKSYWMSHSWKKIFQIK